MEVTLRLYKSLGYSNEHGHGIVNDRFHITAAHGRSFAT